MGNILSIIVSIQVVYNDIKNKNWDIPEIAIVLNNARKIKNQGTQKSEIKIIKKTIPKIISKIKKIDPKSKYISYFNNLEKTIINIEKREFSIDKKTFYNINDLIKEEEKIFQQANEIFNLFAKENNILERETYFIRKLMQDTNASRGKNIRVKGIKLKSIFEKQKEDPNSPIILIDIVKKIYFHQLYKNKMVLDAFSFKRDANKLLKISKYLIKRLLREKESHHYINLFSQILEEFELIKKELPISKFTKEETGVIGKLRYSLKLSYAQQHIIANLIEVFEKNTLIVEKYNMQNIFQDLTNSEIFLKKSHGLSASIIKRLRIDFNKIDQELEIVKGEMEKIVRYIEELKKSA